MGVSTVEAHLSHVYRKLGVRRAELAARLAEHGRRGDRGMTTTVVGRDEELAAVEAFLARIEEGPARSSSPARRGSARRFSGRAA